MSLFTRRGFLTISATSVCSVIAGCSSDDKSSGGEGGAGDDKSSGGEGGAGGDGGESHTVEMTGELTFEPDTLMIAPGDTVVWENVSNANHTVTADDNIPPEAEYFASGVFKSEEAAREGYNSDQDGVVAPDETYEHTFAIEGTYQYYCIPHENHGMGGRVIVREE